MKYKKILQKVLTENRIIKKRVDKYHRTMREKYVRDDVPTIISTNCTAGIIYHNLGLPFQSPTINLTISNQMFIKFIRNLDSYLSAELKEGDYIVDSNYTYGGYPTGILNDITLLFNHYSSFQEARDKWEQRKKRIDWNQIYIIMSDDTLSDRQLADLADIQCRRLVVFSRKECSDLPYVFQLKCCSKKSCVGSFANMQINGFRVYEKEFDYSAWLCDKDDYRCNYFSQKGKI